jgi:hypothetical protein
VGWSWVSTIEEEPDRKSPHDASARLAASMPNVRARSALAAFGGGHRTPYTRQSEHFCFCAPGIRRGSGSRRDVGSRVWLGAAADDVAGGGHLRRRVPQWPALSGGNPCDACPSRAAGSATTLAGKVRRRAHN